jgi:hypothetical protein
MVFAIACNDVSGQHGGMIWQRPTSLCSVFPGSSSVCLKSIQKLQRCEVQSAERVRQSLNSSERTRPAGSSRKHLCLSSTIVRQQLLTSSCGRSNAKTSASLWQLLQTTSLRITPLSACVVGAGDKQRHRHSGACWSHQRSLLPACDSCTLLIHPVDHTPRTRKPFCKLSPSGAHDFPHLLCSHLGGGTSTVGPNTGCHSHPGVPAGCCAQLVSASTSQ